MRADFDAFDIAGGWLWRKSYRADARKRHAPGRRRRARPRWRGGIGADFAAL